MPSKVKDAPSKFNDTPCDAVNGHIEKSAEKEICEEIKPVSTSPVPEETTIAPEAKDTIYMEEDIDEADKNSTKTTDECESSKDADSKKNDIDNLKDQEFVFIHDTGFVVKIVAQGVEPFDIQVTI